MHYVLCLVIVRQRQVSSSGLDPFHATLIYIGRGWLLSMQGHSQLKPCGPKGCLSFIRQTPYFHSTGCGCLSFFSALTVVPPAPAPPPARWGPADVVVVSKWFTVVRKHSALNGTPRGLTRFEGNMWRVKREKERKRGRGWHFWWTYMTHVHKYP